MVTTPHEPFKGNERYEVRGKIGVGGMGAVYRVFDQTRGEELALKTMNYIDPASLYRFKREFRTLVDITHPHLVRLYELTSDEDQWFFTMEYVDGVDFLHYVLDASTGSSPITPEPSSDFDIVESYDGDAAPATKVMRLRAHTSKPNYARLRSALSQLVSGVSALHAAGHLHRDIKPSNVLVSREGRVVMLDFGLVAKVAPSGIAGGTESFVAGTPAYMSPEQSCGQPVSEASDWYSVGAVLYEVLTGRLPFTEGPHEELDWVELVNLKRTRAPVSPNQLAKDVPVDLNRICEGLLQPNPELRLHGEEILRILDVTAQEAPRAASFRRPVTRDQTFVGREDLLEQLDDAMSAVHSMEPVVVHVHASSGMGKSALIRHYLDEHVEWNKVVVLEGRCYEKESVPYKALDSIVDNLSHYFAGLPRVQVEALLPRDAGELPRVFPVLGRVEAIANWPSRGAAEVDPHALRRRVYGAFRELLGRIAERWPVVMYIDDLQWGDVDSAVMLDELLRPPDPPAILFLGCYRTEDAATSPFLQRHLESMQKLGQLIRRLELNVGPLTDPDATTLARALLEAGGTDAQNGVAESVASESKGLPYFVYELAEYVRRTSNGSALAPTLNVSLTDVLRERIQGLSEAPHSLLEIVAVAGRPMAQEVVLEAAELNGKAHAALEELRTGCFVRSRNMDDCPFIESFHDQIREFVVAQLTTAALSACHGKIARALETSRWADAENLSIHFEIAGERRKAGEYARRAADAAMEMLAYDRAAALYCRSRELLPGDDDLYTELTLRAGEAFVNAGRCADAAEKFLELAGRVDASKALDYKRRAAEQYLSSGQVELGLDVIRDVLAEVGMRLSPTPLAALVSVVVNRARFRMRGLKFVRHSEAEIDENTLRRLDTCVTVAQGLALIDTIRGADFQSRALLLALESGEARRISLALSLASGNTSTLGRKGRRRALELQAAAMRLAKETGDPQALGRATFAHGLSDYLVGQWKSAAEICGEAVEIYRDQCVGVTWDLSSAQRFQIGSYMLMGELNEIARHVPPIFEDARRRGDLYIETSLNRDYHLNWLAMDEPDAGRRAVTNAMDRWPNFAFHLQHYNAVMSLTATDLYEEDYEAGWERVTSMWSALKRSMLMRVQVLRAEVHFIRARCAVGLSGRPGADREKLLKQARDDASTIAKERMHWTRPLASIIRSILAASEDDWAATETQLRAAATDFDDAHMGLHAASARRRLGEMMGGEKGRRLIAESEEWMRRQNIQDPERMAGIFTPWPFPPK